MIYCDCSQFRELISKAVESKKQHGRMVPTCSTTACWYHCHGECSRILLLRQLVCCETAVEMPHLLLKMPMLCFLSQKQCIHRIFVQSSSSQTQTVAKRNSRMSYHLQGQHFIRYSKQQVKALTTCQRDICHMVPQTSFNLEQIII